MSGHHLSSLELSDMQWGMLCSADAMWLAAGNSTSPGHGWNRAGYALWAALHEIDHTLLGRLRECQEGEAS